VGSQISRGRKDTADGSAVTRKLSEDLEIKLADFETENATLTGDYLQQIVEIVIGDISTILEIRFMCLFMSLGKTLLQVSVSTNLFDPVTHQVDLRKVEVSI